MKRAGVVCGCCDARSVMARCDGCDRPTCAAHLVRMGAIGDASYICVLCALAESDDTVVVCGPVTRAEP